MSFSSSSSSSSSVSSPFASSSGLLWRNRDAAEELLRCRVTDDTKAVSHNVSSSFDVDTCLSRLRRDKAAVVRAAFGAAARTVIHAVEQEPRDDETHFNSLHMPRLLEQWDQLAQLRITSLERAHDNKDSKKVKSSDTISVTSSVVAKAPKSAEKPKPKDAETPKPVTSTPAAVPTPGAAAMDSRSTVSRAVLCTAASIAFDQLTPVHPGHDVDVVDVPQNTSRDSSVTPVVNMGAVLLQAQTLGQRAVALAENAAKRSRQRYIYRRDNALYAEKQNGNNSFLQVPNPFTWKDPTENSDDDMMEDGGDDDVPIAFPPPPPSGDSVSEEWTSFCLPRCKSVLAKGSGHVVYCDVEWSSRHGRMADLLQDLALDNHGPHLIVTTQPEVEAFAQEFDTIESHVRLLSSTSSADAGLRVLSYVGSRVQRRKLRQHFSSSTGLPGSPFHVMVTSYSVLLQDYLHLCQLPYQVVLFDDGLSWLAAAHSDPNSSVGVLWENCVWSSSDQHVGLAGTSHQEWDFCGDPKVKDACIGLTARHRILTTSSMLMKHRDSRHLTPVPALVSFLLPHFADVVREEWDRSRIVNDPASMDHVRNLLSRSIVVHHPTGNQDDMYQLAIDAMSGVLPPADRSMDPPVPEHISDDVFVAEGKISQSRRSSLSWFGSASTSWLRYELGSTSFQPVLEAMKRAGAHGHLCEEVVTASSTTSSGAGGTVSGTLAYRLAVRCGRNFGSEQGLRQHMAALHAPPGTWLCRTCGSDCGTSQARTHHERSCGQPSGGVPGVPGDQGNSTGGGYSTVGQGVGSVGKQHGPVGVVGKKGGAKGGGSAAGAVNPDDKDSDGSFRVPGYRGVWVNPAGRHFVKIEGNRLVKEEEDDDDDDGNDEVASETLFFDTIEQAARKHDDLLVERGKQKNSELNYREDGSRIMYEDSTPAAAAGRGLEMLGGGASSVVPALSVINIKDLPKDVKPLLRDPRQTSRTGGNSKRHVYAYRGVCRQARKGHDRWQSQISFGGTNHYLGTFDSEWDAAAIYAWAHLILYGEEATRKAQKEGEEAAAAYEQEKKDIAAGKVVIPPPKPAKKKKKKPAKKGDGEGALVNDSEEKLETPQRSDKLDVNVDGTGDKKMKKKRPAAKSSPPSEKKLKVIVKTSSKAENSSIAPVLAKGTLKVDVLAPRKQFESMSDSKLAQSAIMRILAARKHRYCVTELNLPAPVEYGLRYCTPVSSLSAESVSGSAMVLGLSSMLFGWNVDTFLSTYDFDSEELEDIASSALAREYDPEGYNDSFRSVLHGAVCIVGRASNTTERACKAMGFGPPPLGGTVGELDCNIGGIASSCSEAAAKIQYCSSGGGDYQICANNDDDIITLNGQRIKVDMGSFPLFNEDICTVGARVFVFLLPSDT